MFSLLKLILEGEKDFIHTEPWWPGSRQAWDISSVCSLPLLHRSAFPHTHDFLILFSLLTSSFLLRLLKVMFGSYYSFQNCSKILSICYYIRKRDPNLWRSCQGVISFSTNKATCWFVTNWPITLLMKCSKQFRNSSPKIPWIFWMNYSLTAQEENGSVLKEETVINLSWSHGFHISQSHDLPDFITVIFRKWWNYNTTLTKWVEFICICFCLGLSIPNSMPNHTGTVHAPPPATGSSERVSFCPSLPQTKSLKDASDQRQTVDSAWR